MSDSQPALPIAAELLTFWFEENGPQQWYGGGPSFDALVRERFGALLAAAERCELFHWRDTVEGRLAEVVALDQFSRQLYRGSPRAFANDALALALAQEIVAQGSDRTLTLHQRHCLYLPFMHSESLIIHEQAFRLYEALGDPECLRHMRQHHEVIQRFGRYPARNVALGRETTADEAAYLATLNGRQY
ncbi:MAG: DUF924 domain-containing protein [Rhodobacteraceae bacterium]|nr:DUF924 domain-containing protein [Paracoccaceae bacterium]